MKNRQFQPGRATSRPRGSSGEERSGLDDPGTTRLADAESSARDATMTLRQTAEMLQLQYCTPPLHQNGIID